MSNRDARHSRILEATKELFYPCIAGTSPVNSPGPGGHTGYTINAAGQYAYAELYIPWDFATLVEAKVVFIALATLTPMNFRVVTDFCQAEVGYFDHVNLVNPNVNTVLNRVQEVNISNALVGLDNAPLEPKDYLGVQISCQGAQNTNAIFLGVRIRYNTPIYAKAP